jgi:hypothetical protein
LLQSRFEDASNKFFPVFSVDQIENKDKHVYEILLALGKDAQKYLNDPLSLKNQIHVTIMLLLLNHY